MVPAMCYGYPDRTAEATGAGAYAATIPLSRPGIYLAVARDELTAIAQQLVEHNAALLAPEQDS